MTTRYRSRYGAVRFSSSGVRPFSYSINGPSRYDLTPSIGYLCLLLPTIANGNGNGNGRFSSPLVVAADRLSGVRVVETVQYSFQSDPLLPPTFNSDVSIALAAALLFSSPLIGILRRISTSKEYGKVDDSRDAWW